MVVDSDVRADAIFHALADSAPGPARSARLSALCDGDAELASEISTEWPTATGTAGLRELAARYRTEYVLLYRHRFADSTHANGFAAGFITLVGALFLPGTTVESAGVLEATLFDVKTGTILFTVNERVRGETSSTPLGVDRAEETQHRTLVNEGVKRLSDQVLLRMRRLVASR